MSPGGLVPEITNGRGAMAAMLIAFVKEVTSGASGRADQV